MKIEKMKADKMKKLAHKNNLEYIINRDGNICIRPMLFDEDGIRQVRYYPDPCEFETPEQAEIKLNKLINEQN